MTSRFRNQYESCLQMTLSFMICMMQDECTQRGGSVYGELLDKTWSIAISISLDNNKLIKFATELQIYYDDVHK